MRSIKIIALLLLCLSVKGANAQWNPANGSFGGIINTMLVNDSDMYVGSDGGGIFRKSGTSGSWTFMSEGLFEWRNLYINCLESIGNRVIAGTLEGIYYSDEALEGILSEITPADIQKLINNRNKK